MSECTAVEKVWCPETRTSLDRLQNEVELLDSRKRPFAAACSVLSSIHLLTKRKLQKSCVSARRVAISFIHSNGSLSMSPNRDTASIGAGGASSMTANCEKAVYSLVRCWSVVLKLWMIMETTV